MLITPHDEQRIATRLAHSVFDRVLVAALVLYDHLIYRTTRLPDAHHSHQQRGPAGGHVARRRLRRRHRLAHVHLKLCRSAGHRTLTKCSYVKYE